MIRLECLELCLGWVSTCALREITDFWVPGMMSLIFDVGLCSTHKNPKYMKLETRKNRNKDFESVEVEMLCSAAVKSLDNPMSCRSGFPLLIYTPAK